jgi:C4-type Zn-finger protein
MGQRRCPKCGGEMAGPRYLPVVDRLQWVCACGYRAEDVPKDYARRRGPKNDA